MYDNIFFVLIGPPEVKSSNISEESIFLYFELLNDQRNNYLSNEFNS